MGAFGASLLLWYLLRQPYARAMVGCGTRVLSGFAGIPAESLVVERGGRFLLDTGLDAGVRKREAVLDVHPITWNLAVLLALLLATPIRRWRGLGWYPALALLLLWLSHVGFFCLATYAQVAALYEARGEPFHGPALTRLLGLLAQGFGVALSPLLPFLLYAPALLWRRAQARPAPGAPGRNDPCPCGSGLKHKRCCGR